MISVRTKLDETNIQWSEKKSLCIVLCSKGYPESYKKNVEIKNINKIKLDQNNLCFHAGTKSDQNKIFAIGGRVLNFVSLSETFLDAKENIINNLNSLEWNDGFYRKDIGYKVID